MNGAEPFPSVLGTNLEAAPVRLPEELGGRLNLLLIAFRQHRQADVDTWLPYAAVCARTIALYHDKAAFQAALGVAIYVLLIDRGGAVRWRSDGRWSPAKGAALDAAIDRPPP